MSQYQKIRNSFLSHFGDDDIQIRHFRLNAVHQIPEVWADGQEIDFYLDDGTGMYLLTIRNSSMQKITVYGNRLIQYIVAEIPVNGDFLQILAEFLYQLEKIPYHAKTSKKGKIFYL
ncbi:MAG TPA: hypothetical protein DCO72_07615 [Ruminococcus sp.]|nr:hypothetical protein [Ruminococcus sp.]